jgi:hypothetical protein
VLAGSTERDQQEPLGPAVDELPADVRPDADELARLDRRLLAVEQEAEGALEDEVDLLLVLMPVDPAALAGLQHDLVEAERRDAELGAEALEALRGVGVEACGGGPLLHGAPSYCAPYRTA